MRGTASRIAVLLVLAVLVPLMACQPGPPAAPSSPTIEPASPSAATPPVGVPPTPPSPTAKPATVAVPNPTIPAYPGRATPINPPVAGTPADPPFPPERVDLLIAGSGGREAEVRAELALDPAQRARGLMYRERLEEGEGMLFIFPADTTSGFWMRNTLVPLSIAFIAADGAIVGLADMEPLTTEIHYPPGPYRYALEVPRGFFARAGIGVGDVVEYRSDGERRPLPELPATTKAR